MSAAFRSPSLEDQELMFLRGRCFDADEDCTSEECELDSECSEEGRGGGGVRSSLSLEIHGLQREPHVYFSNREYYRRLEELKNAHLRNMAELERMYVSYGGDGGDGRPAARGRGGEAVRSFRKLQRINSQEELDLHETSSGSDQSELCGDDGIGELELDGRRTTPDQDRTFVRDILLSPEEATTQKRFWFQPERLKPHGRPSRPSSKVTMPKPFQMMLREEDRKRHKVRTRSEIELENTLLRRELEELRECQKKFRAAPAPAHIHLPLYEIISRRSAQRSDQRGRSGGDRNRRDSRSNRASPAAASPQPFHFLERERRKREAKIAAELGNLGQKEERQVFRARPIPRSLYGNGPEAANRRPRFVAVCSLEREAADLDLDPEAPRPGSDPDPRRPPRCLSSRKKQMELSIGMTRGGRRARGEPEPPRSDGGEFNSV